MTLQNLLRIGRLNSHVPTAPEAQRLLAAVERNLANAAHKAIMQSQLVAEHRSMAVELGWDVRPALASPQLRNTEELSGPAAALGGSSEFV